VAPTWSRFLGGRQRRPDLPDGRYDVRFRLWDVVRGQDLGGQVYTVPAGDLRLVSHKIADYIHEKLTGDKGVFSTRIAYVTKSGRQHTLWVADADGENAQVALASPEPIISPAWSPGGDSLAYVSFEARKPVVYVHDVATGRRRLLANFRGSNSAPAWSPDGRSVALTLSRDGGSQLYVMDASGGEPRRLTQSPGIDTEPVFSPDGRSIYFVSDRGGAPQIYRMPASGGAAERVTFSGTYNISPGDQSGWALARLCVARQWGVQAAGHGTGHWNGERNYRHGGRREPQFRAEQPPHRLCHSESGARGLDDDDTGRKDQGQAGWAGWGYPRAELGAVPEMIFQQEHKHE
jgi:Tol biopolymer transport system component